MGVLCPGGVLGGPVSVVHIATLSAGPAILVSGLGAAILVSAILDVSPLVTPSAAGIVVVFCWLPRLCMCWRGNCQVISNFAICLLSINLQIGLPATGILLIASAHVSGTSMSLMITQSLCWDCLIPTVTVTVYRFLTLPGTRGTQRHRQRNLD